MSDHSHSGCHMVLETLGLKSPKTAKHGFSASPRPGGSWHNLTLTSMLHLFSVFARPLPASPCTTPTTHTPCPLIGTPVIRAGAHPNSEWLHLITLQTSEVLDWVRGGVLFDPNNMKMIFSKETESIFVIQRALWVVGWREGIWRQEVKHQTRLG
jgi:hypothetical protein